MQIHEPHWSSRVSFIFAASAAAVGLGNIWRFPYMLGQQGGGAFVLIYLACVFLLGMPLLTAEVVLGRIGQRNPAWALARVAKQSGRSTHWRWAGGLTILAGFLIVSYYVVIVGWVLDYCMRALFGGLQHLTQSSSTTMFHNMQHNFFEMLFTDSLVVVATIGIIYLGLKRGLERAVMIMFPALLTLLFILIAYAMSTGYFTQSLAYLFKPELHEVTAHTFLLALGQAFFSLNVAMGITMMFSAYLPEEVPLMSSVVAITIADTGIALLAGMVVFPIVFANHLSPGVGPSLIFQTLPLAFSHMALGHLIGSLFFIMLFVAAFTSVIAMFEPSVRWIAESCQLSRHKSAWCVGMVVWVLSLGSIASFSHKIIFKEVGFTFFKTIDHLTATVMLPIGGLLIAIFTGWLLSADLIKSQLGWRTDSTWFKLWRFLLRYIAPLAIVLILLTAAGVI